jgi:hypothetical protein
MSSGLLVLAFALALGAAVVVVGLRRNLSETTRNGLPRFEGEDDRPTVTPGLYEGVERPRRPPSRRQWRWFVLFYVLWAFSTVAIAIFSSHDRSSHEIDAAIFMVGVVVLVLRRPRDSPEGPTS